MPTVNFCLSQLLKMLAFMDAQPRDVLAVEITVSAAAVEMLQHRILRVHV